MRIVYCADFIYPREHGGSARYAHDLLKGLIGIGVEVLLVTRASKEQHPGKASTNRLRELVGRRCYVEIRTPWDVIAVARRLGAKDIIVAHHPVLGAALSWIRPHNEFYYFFHGPYHKEFQSLSGHGPGTIRYRCKKLLQAGALHRSKRIFVLSEFMKAEVQELNIKVPVEVIGPIIDVSSVPAIGCARGKPGSGKKRLITVRRLIPRTGVLELIEWFRELNPDLYELYIVGSGPLEEEVREAARGSANIFPQGYLEQTAMHSLLASCDLFVLPSRELEGFGLVILEAFALGVPVIATDRSGGGAEFLRRIDRNLVFSYERAAVEFPGTVAYALTGFVKTGLREMVTRYDPASVAEKWLDSLAQNDTSAGNA